MSLRIDSLKIRLRAVTAALLIAVANAAAGSNGVVELFTSQGCYSCPPADKHLGELATSEADLVALEYHVDYWDTLVYGGAGSWKDPFSAAEFSERQRRYHHARLAGRRGVYTPQMVVNGRYATVGSDRGGVVRALANGDYTPPLDVSVTETPAGLRIDVDGGATTPAVIWLATFLKRRVTDVPGGENQGKKLVNHHIVTGLLGVGEWRGQAVRLEIPLSRAAGEGCAVFVQDEDQGPILGAANCP